MSTRRKNRFPLFQLIILVALGLIGWAAHGLYRSVREVDLSGKSLSSIRNEYLGVSKFIQTNLTEMNEAFSAAIQSGGGGEVAAIEASFSRSQRPSNDAR